MGRLREQLWDFPKSTEGIWIKCHSCRAFNPRFSWTMPSDSPHPQRAKRFATQSAENATEQLSEGCISKVPPGERPNISIYIKWTGVHGLWKMEEGKCVAESSEWKDGVSALPCLSPLALPSSLRIKGFHPPRQGQPRHLHPACTQWCDAFLLGIFNPFLPCSFQIFFFLTVTFNIYFFPFY